MLNSKFWLRLCLAGNVYVEPVVSLDFDIVVIVDGLPKFIETTKNKFKIEQFSHIINLSSKESDIRIQLQTDERYQAFIKKSSLKNLMGYQTLIPTKLGVFVAKNNATAGRLSWEHRNLKVLHFVPLCLCAFVPFAA